MTGIDIKLFIVGIVCLIVGGYGVLNKKRIKKTNYYICKNLLLTAAMMIPFFLFVLFSKFTSTGRNIVDQSAFTLISTLCITALLFVVGLDGYLKREQIKNEMYYQFSVMQLIGSIILVVGTIIFWFKWHHF
jgi:NADH:ubiquinone oxidoreductase subunit 2 (subunit N)